MTGNIIEKVRLANPRIHCITNYVTANDCANILLACGASPIMADCPEESGEITSHCSGLVINLGTLSPQRLEAMLISGKKANELGLPVIFDPVGAGASEFRTNAAKQILSEVKTDIIRGNLSEIRSLAGVSSHEHGVDTADMLTDDKLQRAVLPAKELSAKTGSVTVITGENDIVTDSSSVYRIKNGHPIMSRITGCGCMLSAVMGAFAAAAPENRLLAAVEAVAAINICGETAAARLTSQEGNASCRSYLIDAVYRLTGEAVAEKANIELL